MHRNRLATITGVLLAMLALPLHAAGILVVAPHPDDDIIIAAGLTANAVKRGDAVKVVYMTNGDALGLDQGNIRQGEAVDAQTNHIGTHESDLIFLGYPDAGLREIYDNYPNAGDAYTSRAGQNRTYASRGLGGKDYHRYKFGASAAYNRANILTDLQSIIATYRPDHIVTVSEADHHLDHSTTYYLVRQALDAVVAQTSDYRPTLHKTIVWDRDNAEPAVWPEGPDPTTYLTMPPGLPQSDLDWDEREQIDVPAAMQTPVLTQNPKYLALDAHVSQGGGASFIGRFVHKGEIFWAENSTGSAPPHVEAGQGQVVAQGASVQLNGGQSRNPGGGGLSYHWRQIAGTSVSLSDPDAITPTFTAPTGLQQSELLGFELVVGNGVQNSLPDLVNVSIPVDQGDNIAPQADVAASSQNSADGQGAAKAIDGVADGYPGDHTREWASQGERAGAWIELRWASPVRIDKVVLFDRPNLDDWISGGTLSFSDGSSVPVPALQNDGSASAVSFPARTVTSVRFTVTAVGSATLNAGLAEIQVFSASQGGNHPPVADAGADQTVAQGSLVHLSGAASHDPDGDALTYQWTQVAGNTVALSDARAASPTFNAPTGLAQNATLTFQLVVNDGAQDSQPALVRITVTANGADNVAPRAAVTASSENSADGQTAAKAVDGSSDGYPGDYRREWASAGEKAGAWIELHWDNAVTLDHVVLFDRPNADDQITAGTLTFSDGGSVAVGPLNNDGSATRVDFTPRSTSRLRLTVTGVSASTRNVGLAEIQAFTAPSQVNQPPVANAGPDQTVAQGARVQLDGSASSDPENAALTYAWRQTAGPAVTLTDAATIHPGFTAPDGLTQNTRLSFELTVNDGQQNSAPASVTITVFAPQADINLAPQASVSASSENRADDQLASKAIDGVVDGYPGDYRREWASNRERAGAWIELRWAQPVTVDKVVLFDRPNADDQITAAVLQFSDGSSVSTPALANNGAATTISFAPRTITRVRLTVNATSNQTLNAGLAEFQVFGTAQ